LLSNSKPPPAAEAEPLASAEAHAIREALGQFRGNKVATARHLGISRTTLWRKLRKHGIAPEA